MRNLDTRLEGWEVRLGALERRMDRPRRNKFFIPWIDLGWAIAPWIPGIAVILLTLIGQDKMASALAGLFSGPGR
jgi:hypothetical protein